MDLQQRQDDDTVWMDISERIPTGELYALRWSREGGQLLAIAGPIDEQDIATLQPSELAWQSAADAGWANDRQWREIAVLKGAR